MKTGNAVLTVFFLWLSIDLPIRILTTTLTYQITPDITILVLTFTIPIVLAIISAFYGIETPKPTPSVKNIPRVIEAEPITEPEKNIQTPEPQKQNNNMEKQIDKICNID